MAQVIAGNTVTEVTKTSAKVGCTKVTREDVENLLKSMDVAKPGFEIADIRNEHDSDWVCFTMRGEQGGGGWFAAAVSENPTEPLRWVNRFADICLTRPVAIQLLEYLTKRLGYIAYKKNY